jgi:nucleic acid/nucleotide deaminase of polymorphic system toxin
MERAEAGRLRKLFADIQPIEVTERINLKSMKPQEIAQLLPRFTAFQQGGENPAFGLLVDTHSERIFTLRSGFSPHIEETINGLPFRTGTMTRATAEAAAGVWGDAIQPLGAHIEGQAAAFMRAQRITDAVLYINATTPCRISRGCWESLPIMLAEGSTLTIFNKRGRQLPTFTGLTD